MIHKMPVPLTNHTSYLIFHIFRLSCLLSLYPAIKTENQLFFLTPSGNLSHSANCCPQIWKDSPVRYRELPKQKVPQNQFWAGKLIVIYKLLEAQFGKAES